MNRSELDAALDAIVARFSGTPAIAARHVGTGEEILINADAPLGTASTFKLAVLVEVFRQIEEDILDPDERVTLRAQDRTLGSGVLKDLLPGAQVGLMDLATLMVTVSDNEATNLLMDRVGGPVPINRTMNVEYGLSSIDVRNRIDLDAIGDDISRLAVASARDLMRLMHLMVEGRLVSARASNAMLAIMRKQQYVDQVPRYFMYNSYAEELRIPQDLHVYCKTGFYPGTRTDTGAIRLPGGNFVCYSVFANESRDRSMNPEAEPIVFNGIVGKLLLDYWWPLEGPATESTAATTAALSS